VKAVGKCLEVHRVRDEAIRRRMGEKKGGKGGGREGRAVLGRFASNEERREDCRASDLRLVRDGRLS
jgi:hypothetical protein